ncbi:MAG: Hcp family type VI secretion system effector [Candidatus Hodarchaeales archaeon]
MCCKVKKLIIPIITLIMILGLVGSSCTTESVQASVMPEEMVGKAFVSTVISDDVIPNHSMAYFAKYEGIDGESKDANHDKWIEILSVDWGAHKPGDGATGPSRRRGAVVIEDLTIIMEYEKASPKLQEKCLKGAVIPELEIELTTMFGEEQKTYLKYELKNVLVTSFDFSGTVESDGPPTLTVSNNFEEVKVTYTEFDEEGTSKGNVEFEYDVEEGE